MDNFPVVSYFHLVATCTFCFSTLAYWTIGFAFLALDACRCPRVLAAKIQPERPYSLSGKEGKPAQPSLRRVCVRVALLQACIVAPACALLAASGAIDADLSHLPGVLDVLRDLAVCIGVEEVLFYYSHRALHSRALYARIHKVHHRFVAPIALAAFYAHPLEAAISNVLPLLVGPMLVRAHVTTVWLWTLMGIFGTQFHHCGYQFTPQWDLQPRFHDRHHETNDCNFGLVGALDWLHGTLRRDAPMRQRAGEPMKNPSRE